METIFGFQTITQANIFDKWKIQLMVASIVDVFLVNYKMGAIARNYITDVSMVSIIFTS
jgi:hypothetical protein